LPEFLDIRSALEYTVRELIPKRRTFIVNIKCPPRGRRLGFTLQLVAESMLYCGKNRGLTLDLPFDTTFPQKRRQLKKFRDSIVSRFFDEYVFDGMPCFALRLRKDVDTALMAIQAVLTDVYGYPATMTFPCEVSDEGPD